MTNLADAYDMIAEGFASAALALRERMAIERAGEPSGVTLPPYDEELMDDVLTAGDPARPVTVQQHGSAAVCPAHNIEYRDGRYGKFCPSQGTDPKWTNDRGYCQITPAKAAAYLRQKAGDPGPLPVTR